MFTRQQAEQFLDRVLVQQCELDEAECKRGVGNALKEALCAMANRPDRAGGVVFVGVSRDYEVSGLTDIEEAQERITNYASDTFNVPLRVTIEVLTQDTEAVLAVIVPPCPSGNRPCHFKDTGPFGGSWTRVNNSSRRMTDAEVRREIAADEVARGAVSPFDRTPYLQAGMDALDDTLVADYIAQVKKQHPASRIDPSNPEQFLRDVSAVAEADGVWHPTPAGLLFFCREPKRHLPQATVEFLHLWGPDLTSPGPDGSMWRTNRVFSGPLPSVIEEIKLTLLERIATRGVLDGFRRHDKPEYPEFVLREAIVNAVAHRDYTLRGSRIQIRLYPDRIEFQSPGGLLPPVTVENIESEHATRNEAIVGLLGELDYMEERGRGYDDILRLLREAGLAPPELVDSGASFTLTVKSHVLMAPETLEWLRQFSGYDLAPHDRLALAYLRVNEKLFNRDYVRLAGVDRVETTQALRRLADVGLLSMRGARGGAYYVLSGDALRRESVQLDLTLTDDERVIALAQRVGKITTGMCMKELSLPRGRASAVLRRLAKPGGVLKPHRSKRWRYYTPV